MKVSIVTQKAISRIAHPYRSINSGVIRRIRPRRPPSDAERIQPTSLRQTTHLTPIHPLEIPRHTIIRWDQRGLESGMRARHSQRIAADVGGDGRRNGEFLHGIAVIPFDETEVGVTVTLGRDVAKCEGYG